MIARTIDAILVLVALEMIVLLVYRHQKRRGMPKSEVISFLGAGAGLLIAVRVVVASGSFALFAAAMLLSLVMHVWHVAQRWR